MPSSRNGGNIKFGIDFEANQTSLNKLKKSLQDLQKIKPGNFEGSREELQRIQKEALQVERALNRAFNPTLNTTNISAFKAELESNGITIKQLSTDMASLGPAGVRAFGLMTTEILTTNLQLKETNSLIDSMGKTMINTVKWGIASSVMNSFTQSVQGAFQYVQSLEKSLTNIRIVTGDSTEKMSQFAEQANRSAQALGRSTLDYTKASLTFYQQGLNDQDVQARTEATLKAQNITGAGQQMADYLTSVWNGYKVANEEAELYVDKLAAVADSSASDMSQLAIAMSKVASTASTMGVDVDQLNAQIATVVATTRQAPESVGTAFKTIYTRMNDIKTGSDEAEISLGRYSGKMAELGFNVLDATGHLRDTGQVMEEIGGRWQDLTREQQIYLAQTMGGQRQVNQLMALFDNWTTYSELLNTSLESEGTLAEKNARYMESLGAKMEQLGAAGERVKASFLTADMINPVLTGLTGATNLLGSFIEAIGGGVPALMGLSSAMLQAFGPVISREINSVITNMQNVRENAARIAEDIKLTKQLNDQIGQKGKDSGINEQAISNITQEITERKEALRDYYGIMEAGEINAYNTMVKSIGEQKTESEILKIRIQNAEDLANGIVKVKEEIDATTKEGQQLLESLSPDNIQGTLGIVEQEFDNLKNTIRSMSTIEIKNIWATLFGEGSSLPEAKVIAELIPNFQKINEAINEINDSSSTEDIIKLKDNIINFAGQASRTIKDLDEQTLDNLKNQLKDVENNLSQAQKQADQFVEKMQQISLAKSFTEILQGTTRLMTGFTSLGGVIDTVFDKKIPTIEKFSKTIMGLGYAVPSIVSGFNALQKSMGPIAAHFFNQTEILEKYNNLQQVNNTIKAAQAVLNKGVASSEMTVAQAQTIAASAKQMSAAAQQSLNAAMLAFPGTWLVAGIVAVTAALTIIPKIYDAVTMSAEQAQQAIQNFNNAQKESSQKYAQAQSDVKVLSEAEDEWNRLSKAAGDYNSTIENLTEEEKERYYELSNLIANYNSSAVIGYDEQGNAIINKNTNLKEQIQLINQAAQAERRRFYSSDEYRQGIKGQKKQEEFANQAVTTSHAELKNTRTAYANEMRSSITSALSTLSEDNQEKIDRYNELLKADEDTLIANQQEVYKMLLEDQERLRSVYGDRIGQIGFTQSVQQASQKYKDKQLDTKNLERDAKAASQLNYQTLFDQLSLNSDAYNQLKELGITNVEGLITSYIEGAGQAFSRANLGSDTYKSAAEKINDDLLQSFVDSITQQQDGKQISINELFGQFIISDQAENGKEDWTFKNLQEKSKVFSTQINRFLEEQSQETINAIKAAKGNANMEKIWEEYFANLLNVEKVKINFDTGRIEKVTSEALQRLNNKVKENINAPLLNEDNIVGKYLRPDLSESQLDFINKRFTELREGTESWSEALQQAQKQMFQLTLASNSSESIGLLDKKVSGEKLSDEEQQQLKTTLQDISNLYPSLRDEVALLNTEWLKGTSAYENALRNIKDVLLNSLAEARDAGNLTVEETMGKAIQAVSSIEDLQSASVLGLFNNEEGEQDLGAYDDALVKIASQYDNCRDEIEKYTTAIRTNNEQLRNTARLELERASRAAQIGAESGIDPTRIDSLIDSYQRIAEGQSNASEEERKFHQEMLQSSQIAAKVANDYINLNDGIEALGKDYKDIHQLFTKTNQVIGQDGVEAAVAMIQASEEMGKTFSGLKENLSDVLGISQDLIGDDWILENAEDIEKAIAGDEEAIIALKDAAFENALIELGIDDKDFLEKLGSDKESIIDLINDIPLGQIDLDTNPAIQALYDLLAQAGYTDSQIKTLMADQGIYIDTVPAQESLNEMADTAVDSFGQVVDAGNINAETVSSNNPTTDIKQNTSFQESIQAVPHTYTNMVMQDPMSQPTPAITRYYAVTKRVEPIVSQEEETKDNTVTAMKVSNAFNAGKGGKISHRNAGGGAKPSSGGGKKGGGKKGGGGSKPKQPNRAKGETRTPDRYRNNTVKANNLANSMEKLQKQQERLGGKGTLNNLKKQLQILEQQNKNIKERIGLQRDEQAELANNLKKYGATFKNGTLDNYFKVHAKIMDEYNKKLAKWNSASADWQEKNKDFLNNAKEVMDKALKDLERYDKLQQEIAENIQKSKDNAQEQINTKLKQFEIKVEASLDLANAKRDWNKFRQDILDEVRDDDILGLNKYRFADLSSYFNDAQTGSIQQLGKRLKTLVGDGSLNMDIFSANYSYQDLKNKIQHMTLTDRKSWLEEIGKVSKDLEGQMEGFKEKVDEIKESIFDTIDAVQDAFDEQMDEYEYLGDLINHNMKIAEMMYGDQAYDQMAKYYDKIEQNNNKQLEFLRQQKDLWYGRMHEEQARMARIASQQGTDSNAYKESRDRFKEYEKHWMDSVKNLNSMIEDSLDNIIDKYVNAINDIFLKFELNLGNGKTFDDIGDEWDMINDKADMFLDKINSAYQIEKLQNAFEDTIGDNEGDIAAQQALNNLMEQQLAYLKDKDKLTQYDVDRANTLLQIEIKRLALQQARSNKNKLRLRRDSQGNYTYQYTADTEAMNKAEQDLADARISLYNSDKAAYVDNLSAIQKSANDIKDKLEDIWTDENLSKEEKLQKSYELEKYYGEKINDLLAENASIRNNLIDSSFEDLARIYNMSVEDLKALPQDQQDAIFKNLIPQADSAVAQMVQTLAGAGGFSGFFDDLLAPLTQAFDDRIASMAEVQEQAQQNLGDITSDYDTLIGQTERLLDDNQQLVKSQERQLTQVQNHLLLAENILKTYQETKDAIAEILKLSYQVQEQDALGVLGVSQKADQKATDKQAASLQEYTSRQTSTSDLGSDYTPYEPNWHSNNFMAGLKSSNVDESSVLTKQNENLLNNTQTQNNYNRFNDYTTKWVDSIAAINNNVFDSINSTLNNILTTNQEYYAKSLSQQEAIEKAIIANQTVHIDADFPNARDVNHIIEAIQSLTALAAQKAGSTTTSAKGGKAHGSKKK